MLRLRVVGVDFFFLSPLFLSFARSITGSRATKLKEEYLDGRLMWTLRDSGAGRGYRDRLMNISADYAWRFLVKEEALGRGL